MAPDMEERAQLAIGAMEALVELVEGQEENVEISTRQFAPLLRLVCNAAVAALPAYKPLFRAND